VTKDSAFDIRFAWCRYVPGDAGAAAMAECAAAASQGGALSPAAAAALTQVLTSWPVESLFPVLDLARMLVLRGVDAGVGAELAGAMAAAAARAIAGAAAPAPNLLTAGRLFCNAFKHPAVRDVFLLHASEILVSRTGGRGGLCVGGV
jgi:phospholipase A-2-activating protein